MNQLRIVKITVFILTFLLVFGTLVLFGSIYSKTKPHKTIEAEISLNEPVGSSVAKIIPGPDALYILIKDGGQSDRIVIFDTESGKRISKIKLY